LGGWFEVHRVYGSDFHLWVYRIYTGTLYLSFKKFKWNMVLLKKIRFYFITDLFSLTESSLQIRRNDPCYCHIWLSFKNVERQHHPLISMRRTIKNHGTLIFVYFHVFEEWSNKIIHNGRFYLHKLRYHHWKEKIWVLNEN